MTSTAPLTSADLIDTSFAYIDCDIPDGQTLVQWRRERELAHRSERRARPSERAVERLRAWAARERLRTGLRERYLPAGRGSIAAAH